MNSRQELKLARSPCDSGSITNYSCAHYPQESRENERTFAVLDEADDDCEPAVVREPDEDADHSTAERKF